MKIRRSDREGEKIKLEMTAMIDVVFQLLVFFVMTYKVTVMEGDFGIRMPLASDAPSMTDPLEDTVYVRLEPDAQNAGDLAAVTINYGTINNRFEIDAGNREASFDGIQALVAGIAAGGRDPVSGGEIEAEIDADYNLRYEETIRVIESLSGRKDEESGQIIKMIEKIRFKDSGI